MISVSSPSMAVIDSRAAVTYQMDHTIRILPSVTMTEIVRAVIDRATQIQGPIDNLILTAHGSPGYFQLGTGLNIHTMNPFQLLRNNVRKIWFRGCLVGRIIDSRTPRDGDGSFLAYSGINSGNGHNFLSAFAALTQCEVIAPTEVQGSRLSVYPPGQMDAWEGLVVTYNSLGELIKQERYRSQFRYNLQRNTSINPNGE